MKDKFSAEDKLLALIKKQPKAIKLPVFFSFLSGFSQSRESSQNADFLRWLVRLAAVIFFASLAVTLYTAVKTFIFPGAFEAVNPAWQSKIAQLFSSKPFSYYQSAFSAKSIFAAPEGSMSRAAASAANTDAEQVISQLVLSGIVAGDNPKAIIEDRKAQKSYFLKEGESFNNIVVEKIGSGRVTLNFDGKTFELVL